SDPKMDRYSPITNTKSSEAPDCHSGSYKKHTQNDHSGDREEESPCTSTTASTMTSSTNSTGAPDQKNVVITVISVLFGVTVVLLMCGFFFRKKFAKDTKKDHVYESVEDVKPAANENNYEAIYVLAGDSAIVSLGKKTDAEPQSSSETKLPKNQ
ncbi:roundabout 2-like, partial [Clarias magur]